jgi:hypothetical protein
MAAPSPDAETAPSTEERAREGVEHLQAAARELIEAARAALDVAEEVVNDPDALAALTGTFSAVGDVARRFTGLGGWPTPGSGPGGDGRRPRPRATPADAPTDDDASRVQRITVTP